MAHDEAAGIGPGDELVVLSAIDLHLLLVEAMPQVAGDHRRRLREALGIVDREAGIGKMSRLRLGDGRRYALGSQAAPGRRQFGERLAIAVELPRLLGADIGKAVGTGKAAIEIIEAAVFGLDDDDIVDLVVTGRRRLG